MSRQYIAEDKYVKCPYYARESSIEIKCQGLCGTHTIQCFDSKKSKDEFKEDFCRSLYWNCPCCIALEEDA